MAKSKSSKGNARKQNKAGGKGHQKSTTDSGTTPDGNTSSDTTSTRYIRLFPLDWRTFLEYCVNLVGLLALALLLGYSVGAGWINITAHTWRQQIAHGIRGSTTFQLITFVPGKWQEVSAQSLKSAA